LVSPATNVDADDRNATKRPSPLIAACSESLSPATPAGPTLTRSVTPGGCAHTGATANTANTATTNDPILRHTRTPTACGDIRETTWTVVMRAPRELRSAEAGFMANARRRARRGGA
jgi:hypothetical protein